MQWHIFKRFAGRQRFVREAFVFSLILGLLLSAVLVGYIEVALGDPYIPAEEAPAGYRIYSNGTTNIPNIRQNGNTYILTSNINGTIIIEADGITLNGASYTLLGDGTSFGVWLQDRANVTLSNLKVSNFEQGIRLSHYSPDWHSGQSNLNCTTNCTVKNCTITGCNYGLSFHWYVFNCSVKDNCIANNTYGVCLDGSGHLLRNNKIDGNKYNFWELGGDNDVDATNTINGKVICYWVNQHNQTVSSKAGIVILKNCSGIRIQNLNLTGNGIGVSLYCTSNSEICGNNITNNVWEGITVSRSNNISIIGNRITDNQFAGIEEYEAGNNIISHNLISGNAVGVYYRTISDYEVLSHNQITYNHDHAMLGPVNHCNATDNYVYGNSGGLDVGSNCYVARNNITNNEYSGIFFRSNCLIENNYISGNLDALNTNEGQGNNITSNIVCYNSGFAVRLTGGSASGNHVYHNNFIHNNNGGVQGSVRGKLDSKENDAIPINQWDNGLEGNYWSDYDPNKVQPENSTIPNNVYFINDNNIDRHPLTSPLEFSFLSLPTIESPPLLPEPTEEPSPFSSINDASDLFTNMATVVILITLAIIPLVCAGFLIYLKSRRQKQ